MTGSKRQLKYGEDIMKKDDMENLLFTGHRECQLNRRKTAIITRDTFDQMDRTNNTK